MSSNSEYPPTEGRETKDRRFGHAGQQHPLLERAALQRILAEGRNRLAGAPRGGLPIWDRPSTSAQIKQWTRDQLRIEKGLAAVEWPFSLDHRSYRDDDSDHEIAIEAPFDDSQSENFYEVEELSEEGGGGTDEWSQLADYYRNISKVALLSAEEEVSLGRKIEVGLFALERLDRDGGTGDDERLLRWLVRTGAQAHQDLILANTRLVVSIARVYQGSGLDLADLIQVGNFGLLRAVQKFDHKLGFKFSTYATWWVRQQITRSIADLGRMIRLPVHVIEDLNRVESAEKDLRFASAVELPSSGEVANLAGVTPDQVRTLRLWSAAVLSLDFIRDELEAEIWDDGEDVLGQVERQLDRSREVAQIPHFVKEKEMAVLVLRHGLDGQEPMTLDRIGIEMGVTRERIRQIEAKAYGRVRKASTRGSSQPTSTSA